MGSDLLPSKAKGLTDDEVEIAHLMVYGLPHEETILGKVVKADWPLTLEQAAKFVGYRLQTARGPISTPCPSSRRIGASSSKASESPS